LIGEVPALIIGIAGIIGCFIGIYNLKRVFKDSTTPGISFFIGLVKAFVIVILANSYQNVSMFLTNWENH
jgi:hypothetical protein